MDTPLTRESLYALVWAEPMTKVASKFGISSSYLARVCGLLNVPRPERGYWAKISAGRRPPIPPLPDPRPGDPLVWSRNGDPACGLSALPSPPALTTRAAGAPRRSIKEHPILIGAKAHLEAGRMSFGAVYPKPAKRNLVDLVVSKAALDGALSFANRLFLALENSGHRVILASLHERFQRPDVDEREKPGKRYHSSKHWTPGRKTTAYVGTVAIGLTIFEMTGEVEGRYVGEEFIRGKSPGPVRSGIHFLRETWSTTQSLPSGRLCLQAYSPYLRTKWMRQWRETRAGELGRQLREIVAEIERAAGEIAGLVKEAERVADIERKKWKEQEEQWAREEAERLAAKAMKESRDDINSIIDRWAYANRVQKFFAEIERRAKEIEGEDRVKLLDRLARARKLIGTTDALQHFRMWRTPEELDDAANAADDIYLDTSS